MIQIAIRLGAIAVAIKVLGVPDIVIFPGKIRVVSMGGLECFYNQFIGVVIVAPTAIGILQRATIVG